MNEQIVTEFMNGFLLVHCDNVVNASTGEVLPFDQVEPYLQDYCGEVGVSWLALRGYLLDAGYITMEE